MLLGLESYLIVWNKQQALKVCQNLKILKKADPKIYLKIKKWSIQKISNLCKHFAQVNLIF